MNRILLSVLIVTLLISPAFCQELDTLQILHESDSLDIQPELYTPDIQPELYTPDEQPELDTPEYYLDPEGYPILESDTVQAGRGADTLAQYGRSPLVQADSLVVVEPDFSHSPSRAIMFALVLPGLGQAYNGQYYKMPIVWVALGAAGWAISYNSREYQLASEDYALLPDETNERYLQFWRRNMELSYIALIAVYALQVLDAYVGAQLHSWNVNDNLSLRVNPSLQPLMTPNSLTGHAYGLTCSFDLKR